MILFIVGVDQVPQLDYYRAKTLQKDLLRQGPTPYSIVRANQFFEVMDAVLSETSDDTTVRLPATRLQPIAAADVVDAVVEVSTGHPTAGHPQRCRPERLPPRRTRQGHTGSTSRPADRHQRRQSRHVRGHHR